MSPVTLSLRREKRNAFKALLARAAGARVLKQALSDRYWISLQENGVPRPVYVGGNPKNELESAWSDSPRLLEYLAGYRISPDGCKPDSDIRKTLRDFLFCNGELAGPVTELMKSGSELRIAGDAASMPLLLNIPWELADGISSLGGTDRLDGTLATLPLVRVFEDAVSTTQLEQERLRVMCCISEPPGVSPIGARTFAEWIAMTLSRSGMVDYTPVGGANFTPRLEDVAAAALKAPPHIFVMFSHGQTKAGKPEVRLDNWTPVEKVARVLAQGRKTFLVFLIACDLAFLEEGATASSGAHAFLENGIPAVVAMQGKVQAQLGATFVTTTLDRLIGGPALSAAVAAGRVSMGAEQWRDFVDWSFPGLFQSRDGHEKTAALGEYFQFKPALEALLRSIPKNEPYLPRPAAEAAVAPLLATAGSGLKIVYGPRGVGKTYLVREVARAAIRAAIDASDAKFRPILYLDLNRNPVPIQSAADLVDALTKRADEVKPALAGPPVINLKIPRPRAANGSGQVIDPLRQATELIDLRDLVIILDHVPDPSAEPWRGFLGHCATLLRSSVIVVLDTPEQNLVVNQASAFRVRPFTAEESAAYVAQYWPAKTGAAAEWFQETAGIPLLLNALAHGGSASGLSGMVTQLPAPQRDFLTRMAQLSDGVGQDLAREFIPGWKDVDVPALVGDGLLLNETRFGLGHDWFRLPGLIERTIQDALPEASKSAGAELAESFVARIAEDDPEEALIALSDRPGGMPFIHEMQTLLIGCGTPGQVRGIHAFLHQHLFRRGQWWDAYHIAKRAVSVVPFEETEAGEWLQLAKAQQVLGHGGDAKKSLDKAMSRELTPLQQVDALEIGIALLKDEGAAVASRELEAYNGALDLLDRATGGNEEDEEEKDDKDTVAARRATILYNRGVFRAHWCRDTSGAMDDLDAARLAYEKLGDRNMEGMSNVEWAEVQIGVPGWSPDWQAVFERLAGGIRMLEDEKAAGDLGFAFYHLARFYRRRPAISPEERTKNLYSARESYERAARWAALARDSKQEAIAEGHVAEVSWKDLRDVPAPDVVAQLEPVIATLRTFRGNAWAVRVLRDMLVLLYEVQSSQKMTAPAETIEDAWTVATGAPLHAERGTDARRAAHILAYLLQGSTVGMTADLAAASAKPLVEAWLGRSVNVTDFPQWLPAVKAYGRGSGEYDG